LTAVLKEVDRQAVDKIICLGDTVGYYTNPNECLEIIRERGVQSIAGNHDRAATGLKEPILGCGVFGRRAISWTRPRLTPDNKQFLDGLPIMLVMDERFLMVHGTLYPTPNEEIYLTPHREVIQRNFNALIDDPSKVKISFFGHTHHGVVYEYSNGSIHTIGPGEITLNPDDYYLINPGSVGQSRDPDPRAAFLTYDTEKSWVRFYRIDYDHSASQKKAERAGLPYQESHLRKLAVRILDFMGIKGMVKNQMKRMKKK
jgi:predicted phosphodiesterase